MRTPSIRMAKNSAKTGGLLSAMMIMGSLWVALNMTSASGVCEQGDSQIFLEVSQDVSKVAGVPLEGGCSCNSTKTLSVYEEIDGGTPPVCGEVYCVDSVKRMGGAHLCVASQCHSACARGELTALINHRTAGQRCSGAILEPKMAMLALPRGGGWRCKVSTQSVVARSSMASALVRAASEDGGNTRGWQLDAPIRLADDSVAVPHHTRFTGGSQQESIEDRALEQVFFPIFLSR